MGKIHGSLARAGSYTNHLQSRAWCWCPVSNSLPLPLVTGKVKNSTPKVEPTEKPKIPKGRAYKRRVYIRRFINVAMTSGKRKVRSRGVLAHGSGPGVSIWFHITGTDSCVCR